MKSFAKIIPLFVLALTLFATAPVKGTPTVENYKSFMLSLRGSNHVQIGTIVATELYSHYSGDAHLTVENAKGQAFVATDVRMKYGKNIVKFKVSEIPSGIYFIKVTAEGKTETTHFVVE